MAELILTFQFDLHKLYKHKTCITTVKIMIFLKEVSYAHQGCVHSKKCRVVLTQFWVKYGPIQPLG